MADSSDEEDEDSFRLLERMPTSRLNDIVVSLEKQNTSVITLDACLPPKEAGELVLKTILYKMTRCVKVLSLRYNNFSSTSCDLLIEWMTTNDYLETIYVMGCQGIETKVRGKLEDAWRKNLIGHHVTNFGFTMTRVTPETLLKQEQAGKLA